MRAVGATDGAIPDLSTSTSPSSRSNTPAGRRTHPAHLPRLCLRPALQRPPPRLSRCSRSNRTTNVSAAFTRESRSGIPQRGHDVWQRLTFVCRPKKPAWRSPRRRVHRAWRPPRRYCFSVGCESEPVAEQGSRTSSQADVSGARAETFALRKCERPWRRCLSAGRRLRVLGALVDLARELEQCDAGSGDPRDRRRGRPHPRPGSSALSARPARLAAIPKMPKFLDPPSSR
jgi:hypothetical protein